MAAPQMAAAKARKPDFALLTCMASGEVAPATCPGIVVATRPLSAGEAIEFWDAPELAGVREQLVLPIEGYVTSTNLVAAPDCALRLFGLGEQDCVAPVPAVWIGERPDAAPSESLQLVGFAPTFGAMVLADAYDAVAQYGDVYLDPATGRYVEPRLPVVGTRVSVRATLVQSTDVPVAGAAPVESRVARAVIKAESEVHAEPGAHFEPWPPAERGYTVDDLWPLESWAKARALSLEVCEQSELSVILLAEANVYSKQHSTRLYVVTCSTSTPNFGSYTDEAGESFQYEVSRNQTNHVFLAYQHAGERILEEECTDGTGFESSYSCDSYWFVLPGAGSDLDLLVRLGQGCSDGGCDGEFTVRGFDGDVELPPFPDGRRIVGGKLELVGREVHIEGRMECTEAEWTKSSGPYCAVLRRYVLSYDHGKLRIRRH